MDNKIGNNNMKKKLETVEKILQENYAAHQKEPLPINNQWMVSVMERIQLEPIPTQPRFFDLSSLQEKLVWRFSGVAATVSLVLLVLYLTLGRPVHLEMIANMLLDPLAEIGLGLLGV